MSKTIERENLACISTAIDFWTSQNEEDAKSFATRIIVEIMAGREVCESFTSIATRIFDECDEQTAIKIIKFISNHMKEMATSLDAAKREKAPTEISCDAISSMMEIDDQIYSMLMRQYEVEHEYFKTCEVTNNSIKCEIDANNTAVGVFNAIKIYNFGLLYNVKNSYFYRMMRSWHSNGYADKIFDFASESLRKAAKEIDAVKARHIHPGKELKEYLEIENNKVRR